MAYTVAQRNAALSGIIAGGAWLSLHSADPGTTGASERSGGSPAYARVQTTWGSPASGSVSGSAQTLNVPAGTVSHFGVWSASTGGTFLEGGALAATETYAGDGTYTLTPTLTA